MKSMLALTLPAIREYDVSVTGPQIGKSKEEKDEIDGN
jgi:hypothetical protein